MNENSIKLLENYLKEKDYKKYNEILSKEIISIFVKKIQEKKEDFLYSNVLELLEFSEIYLDKYCSQICSHFYELKKMGLKEDVIAEQLMSIYEKIINT